jgi:hypothetical protein
VSTLLRRLARRGLYKFFQAMLEKEKYGLQYVPAETVGYAVVCPLYARSNAEEREVAVFTRVLLDRVRCAELLKLLDVETLTSVVRRAAKGDRKAMEWLLEVGRGPHAAGRGEGISRAPPGVSILQQGGQRRGAERTGGGGLPLLQIRRAPPLCGLRRYVEQHRHLLHSGGATDYVYIFKYNREGVEYSVAKAMAAAEGDVAAKIWRRPKVKLHIQERGKPPKLTFVEPKDPEPHYKALLRGRCRKGPICPACPLKDICECLK